MNLQRYDLDAESSSMGGYVEMRPCNVVGEWVKASEAEAEIAALKNRVQELEKIAEAASWLVIKIEDGVNVGRYRHCGNGSTYIPFDRWEALNNAFEEVSK